MSWMPIADVFSTLSDKNSRPIIDTLLCNNIVQNLTIGSAGFNRNAKLAVLITKQSIEEYNNYELGQNGPLPVTVGSRDLP